MVKKEDKTKSNSLSQRLKNFRRETRKHTATALMTAFGIVLALTWKGVIDIYVVKWVQALTISTLSDSLLILYSAIITTILIILGILATNKWVVNKEKEDAQR